MQRPSTGGLWTARDEVTSPIQRPFFEARIARSAHEREQNQRFRAPLRGQKAAPHHSQTTTVASLP